MTLLYTEESKNQSHLVPAVLAQGPISLGQILESPLVLPIVPSSLQLNAEVCSDPPG